MEGSLAPAMLMAFVAGLISFLSPCVLPLVPGYLSIISGVSLDRLKSEAGNTILRKSVIFSSLMFILGFSITFVALGASATAVGQLLLAYRRTLTRIAGLVIIIFALHLLGIFRIQALYQDKRMHNIRPSRGALGAVVLGLVFAFGWSPCIGPILGSIMGIAMQQDTASKGAFLLAVYSAGLGVPFLMTSLGLNRFLAFYSRFKRHFRALEVVSGILVLGIGVLIITDQMTSMNQYFQILSDFEIRMEGLFMRMVGG